jgi:hypothetical protein
VKISLARKLGTTEESAKTKAACFSREITGKTPKRRKSVYSVSLLEGGFFSSATKLDRSWETNAEHREMDNFAM